MACAASAGAGSVGPREDCEDGGDSVAFRLVVVAQTTGVAKRKFRPVRSVDARAPNPNLAPMRETLPPCPYLPAARPELDWRALHAFRAEVRGEAFYFLCLEYAQTLWQRGLAARALLCLDRALGAELSGEETILRDWPLPYAAMAWCIAQTPTTVFIGNPRVHFQHYADRMNAPRREQRRWRAWACWALTRTVRPEFMADPRHVVVEPAIEHIAAALATHGVRGESAQWRAVLAAVTTSGRLKQ